MSSQWRNIFTNETLGIYKGASAKAIDSSTGEQSVFATEFEKSSYNDKKRRVIELSRTDDILIQY